MRKIIFGLAIVAMAVTTSAFTKKQSSLSIEAGILSIEVDPEDNSRMIYVVEEYAPSKLCVNSTPSDACSFTYDGPSLPSSVHADDPLISNLNSGKKYQ